MTRLFLLGAETGDVSELSQNGTVASGVSADSVTVNDTGSHGGGYSYKFAAVTGQSTFVNGATLSEGFFKTYFRYDTQTTPGTTISYFLGAFQNGATTQCIVKLLHGSDGTFKFTITDTNGVVQGTSANLSLSNNTWYRIEIDLKTGAGSGACNVYLDGVSKLALTSQQFTASTIQLWAGGQGAGGSVTGRNWWFDDLEIDDAALCGVSFVIARQFTTGTPTYNGWTKTGGSGTIDSVWDDTPFNATKFAVSPSQTAAIAQTALTATFASTQTGHGNGTISASDTINSIKVGGVAKASSTSSSRGLGSIRYRSNSVDTDFNVTMTTGDVYYEHVFGTDTLTNLNASEAGWNRRASTVAGTQTVEDVWVMASYTPVTPVSPNVNLVGASSASAAGSFVPTGNPPFTGASSASAAGSFSDTISSNVSLVGAAIASAAGTLVPEIDVSLSGVAGISAAGSFVPSTSITLAGVAGVTAAGSFSEQIDSNPALTGVQGTSAAGSFVPSIAAALAGAPAISAAGSFSIQGDESLALIGAPASSAAGAFVPEVDIGLGSAAAASAAGDLGPQADQPVSGASAIAQAGIFGPAIGSGLMGAQAAAQPGSFGIQGDVAISLTGVQAASDAGSLAIELGPDLVGVQSSALAGDFGPAADFSLDGAQADTAAGVIIAGTDAILAGVEAVSAPGHFTINIGGNTFIPLIGVEAQALAGDLAPLIELLLVGAQTNSETGAFDQTDFNALIGVQANSATATPSVVISIPLVGAAAIALPGIFGAFDMFALIGVEARARAGRLRGSDLVDLEARALEAIAGAFSFDKTIDLMGPGMRARAGKFEIIIVNAPRSIIRPNRTDIYSALVAGIDTLTGL